VIKPVNLLIMKQKLSLNELKIKSFVTDVKAAENVLGGARKTLADCMTNNSTMNPICDTFTLTDNINTR